MLKDEVFKRSGIRGVWDENEWERFGASRLLYITPCWEPRDIRKERRRLITSVGTLSWQQAPCEKHVASVHGCRPKPCGMLYLRRGIFSLMVSRGRQTNASAHAPSPPVVIIACLFRRRRPYPRPFGGGSSSAVPSLSIFPIAGRSVRAQEDPWTLNDFEGPDHVHLIASVLSTCLGAERG